MSPMFLTGPEKTAAPIWTAILGDSPVVALAIHDGHELRPEVQSIMKLSQDERLREEDPYTGRLADIAPTRFVARRSRFEMDLNRPREACIYIAPESAWGLTVWRQPPSRALIDDSRAQYDAFYRALRRALRELEQRWGRFLVLDLHSYNHRRGGADAPPAPTSENPVINLGTGSMDRAFFAPVVDAFQASLARATMDGAPIDVRENVRFKGGHLSRWVHETFPRSGCAIAIELKKVFMDEWTGALHEARFEALEAALQGAVAPAAAALLSLCGAAQPGSAARADEIRPPSGGGARVPG